MGCGHAGREGGREVSEPKPSSRQVLAGRGRAGVTRHAAGHGRRLRRPGVCREVKEKGGAAGALPKGDGRC